MLIGKAAPQGESHSIITRDCNPLQENTWAILNLDWVYCLGMENP